MLLTVSRSRSIGHLVQGAASASPSSKQAVLLMPPRPKRTSAAVVKSYRENEEELDTREVDGGDSYINIDEEASSEGNEPPKHVLMRNT